MSLQAPTLSKLCSTLKTEGLGVLIIHGLRASHHAGSDLETVVGKWEVGTCQSLGQLSVYMR